MEQLSAEYGWSPSEIRKEKAEDILTYWAILQTKRKIQKEESKK